MWSKALTSSWVGTWQRSRAPVYQSNLKLSAEPQPHSRDPAPLILMFHGSTKASSFPPSESTSDCRALLHPAARLDRWQASVTHFAQDAPCLCPRTSSNGLRGCPSNSTEHFARRKHANVACVARHVCHYTASQSTTRHLQPECPIGVVSGWDRDFTVRDLDANRNISRCPTSAGSRLTSPNTREHYSPHVDYCHGHCHHGQPGGERPAPPSCNVTSGMYRRYRSTAGSDPLRLGSLV